MEEKKTVSIDLWAPKFPVQLHPNRRAVLSSKRNSRVHSAVTDRRLVSSGVQAIEGHLYGKGVEALLEGSNKSHYNTMIGHSHIPHKYDHFHEKTYVPRPVFKAHNLTDYFEKKSLSNIETRKLRKNQLVSRKKAITACMNRFKFHTANSLPRK